ncbi:Neugrin [Holothuria leucospilota]|uniref:Neugrin n=1 Tax=Holothuria leucospilota TaxID=206669 RepID=A0A9Q1H1U9_HOLLE|nr:Neugrin [Holothuria leucospilota]
MAVPQYLSQWRLAVKYPHHGLFYLPHQSCGRSAASVLCRTFVYGANWFTFRSLQNGVLSCTNSTKCTPCNCAFSMKCANNGGSALRSKILYLILEKNFTTKFTVSFLSRKFSVVQSNFARSKDESPGSEAIFREELKKMKEREYMRDDINEDTTFKEWAQDYANRGNAMKYAKRAKYLGQERQERTLTWDNIDQIRFLRQEHPDEWSVSQLAKSFDVSQQTIKKILKSKFTPDAKTRQYQDKIAVRNVGKNTAIPPSHDTNTNHILLDEGSKHFSKGNPKEGSEDNNRHVDNRRNYFIKDRPSKNVLEMNLKETKALGSAGSEHWEEDEDIDLEEELEEAEAFSSLKAADFVQVYDEGIEAPKVIQRGREFYDSDGEFLFKI